MLGLLAWAFAGTDQTGELRQAPEPILFKKPFNVPSSPFSATDSTAYATACSTSQTDGQIASGA